MKLVREIRRGFPADNIGQKSNRMKVIDNALNGNVLSMRLWRNRATWSGGTAIDITTYLNTSNAPTSYSGFDLLPTTQEDLRVKATFHPSQIATSVVLSGIQMAVNKGDQAVINLIGTEMEYAMKFLKDDLGTQIYGDGTGNSSKDVLGLQAAIDDATSVTTYGNISRSTYSNWKATRTAQSGSLTLADLAADFDAATVGNETPTLIVTTPAIFSIYEALLTPTVSHQFSMNDFRMTGDGLAKVGGTLAANQGFRALTFRGVPIVADEKCTSGNIYFLNENHLQFYVLPQPSETVERDIEGFGWTGFKIPTNQDAVVGHLKAYLQLICDGPRFNARRTGVTS